MFTNNFYILNQINSLESLEKVLFINYAYYFFCYKKRQRKLKFKTNDYFNLFYFLNKFFIKDLKWHILKLIYTLYRLFDYLLFRKKNVIILWLLIKIIFLFIILNLLR